MADFTEPAELACLLQTTLLGLRKFPLKVWLVVGEKLQEVSVTMQGLKVDCLRMLLLGTSLKINSKDSNFLLEPKPLLVNLNLYL